MLRVGHGYDVHRLAEGRRLVIGGVDIPYSKGLVGHSDADVLLHAICDALLGAAAMGDIGCLFPDTDDKYEGISSIILLTKTVEAIKSKGYSIVNVDSTLAAQAPKMRAFIDEMRRNISAACEIDVGCVSVKATTEEGLGFTGSGEGMSATAVCLIASEN